MKDYLDTMHESTKEIECSVHVLDSLASAFLTTGNVIMADELYRIAGNLLDSEKNISDAVRREVHSQFETVQESSANLLRTMLAAKG